MIISDGATNQNSLEEAETNTADVEMNDGLPTSSRTGQLKKFNCQFCTYNTNYFSHFKRHMIKHNGERNFECKECLKRFATNSHLKRHAVIHLHKCKLCDKEINESECCLCDDTQPKKIIRCDVCNYRAKDSDDLNLHKNTDAHQKPFKCDVCSKDFSQKHHLERHISNVHQNQKTYECEICK